MSAGLFNMYTSPVLKIVAAAAFLFTFAFSLSAQTPTPTPKEDEGVIKVESRLVVIPVSVTDANGQPVQGLTKNDFKVVEEGKPQTIDNVGSADAVPLEIVLLFDVSASTDAMFKFEQETAAKFLLDVLKPKDRATVFTVGAEPKLIQPRDTAEKSIAAIRSITPTKEYTAFYDSVGAAAEYLQKNAPEGTRRVIIVISDGEDTNSTRIAQAIQNGYRAAGDKVNTLDQKSLYQMTVANRDKAAMAERTRISKSIQDADTVFYSINPAGSSYQLNQMSVFGQQNMEKFASETGGTAFLPKFAPVDTKDNLANESNIRKNQQVLDRIFSQLASELRAQYLIQYYPEGEYPNGRFVKLSVTLANPSRGKVRAREGYYVKQ
jgi:Ca-activated chloride channel family protein